MSLFPRLAVAGVIFFAAATLGACAITPTIVGRDAAILPQGNWEANAGGAIAVLFPRRWQGRPPSDDRAYLGAMQFDVSARQGLGEGSEQAFRGGVAIVGAYAGYERAYSLIDDAGGLVWFAGGVGGANFLDDGLLPFVQPYTGLIAGSTSGVVRPEIAFRLAGQAGVSSISADEATVYAYAIGFASVEPRVRVGWENLTAYAGLQLGAGVGRCQECFESATAEQFFLIAPGAGISYAFDSPTRTEGRQE